MRDFLFEKFDANKKTVVDVIPKYEDEILLKIYDWSSIGRIILPNHIGGIDILKSLHRRKLITWEAPIMELTEKGYIRMITEVFRRKLHVNKIQKEGIQRYMCIYHNPKKDVKFYAKQLDTLPETLQSQLRGDIHLIQHNTDPLTYELRDHAKKVCKEYHQLMQYIDERTEERKKWEEQSPQEFWKQIKQ